MNIETILSTDLYREIITASIIFIGSVIAAKLVFFILERYVTKITKKTRSTVDDEILQSIKKPIYSFVILLGAYFALISITVVKSHSALIYKAFTVIAVLIFVFTLTKIIGVFMKWYANTIAVKTKTDLDERILPIIQKILNIFIYFIAFIIILDQFGVEITPLIASLGIGGLAVALALQNILTDIFASFSIYFDKPFEIGDFIIVGNDLGVVKKIGIKTTRLESLWGQEIVISNTELTSTRINNYKKMEKRRIHFTFGVVYGTSTKKLKKILGIVKDIFNEIELADIDRVHFKEFGDFSLNFEVAYYISTGDYNKYMDVQQEINFALKEQFEKEGIEFAYPTQTIFVNK